MDAAHHGGWLGHRSSVLEPRRGSGPAGVDSVGVGQAANIPPGRAQGGVWCGLGGGEQGVFLAHTIQGPLRGGRGRGPER